MRCYSLRANGDAAGLCRALAMFVAFKSSITIRRTLRQFDIHPESATVLTATEQKRVLGMMESIVDKSWRSADLECQLAGMCRRIRWRWCVEPALAEAGGAQPEQAPDAARMVEDYFRESGAIAEAARRKRDEIALARAAIQAALGDRWQRPFASTIANDHTAQAMASGAGD